MSEWQPIATVPEDILHIEGSFDGKNFHNLYSRWKLQPGGVWMPYEQEPQRRAETPPFWRPVQELTEKSPKPKPQETHLLSASWGPKRE
jgi:hypothetical protein